MIRAITRFSVISNQDLSTKMLSLLVHIIIWIHNEANLATKPEWVFYVRTGYAMNWIRLNSRRSCGDEETRGASEAQVNINNTMVDETYMFTFQNV